MSIRQLRTTCGPICAALAAFSVMGIGGAVRAAVLELPQVIEDTQAAAPGVEDAQSPFHPFLPKRAGGLALGLLPESTVPGIVRQQDMRGLDGFGAIGIGAPGPVSR